NPTTFQAAVDAAEILEQDINRQPQEKVGEKRKGEATMTDFRRPRTGSKANGSKSNHVGGNGTGSKANGSKSNHEGGLNNGGNSKGGSNTSDGDTLYVTELNSEEKYTWYPSTHWEEANCLLTTCFLFHHTEKRRDLKSTRALQLNPICLSIVRKLANSEALNGK
ncbi:hypothetical protein Ccrd_026031, partial [Cynara cardunculus var. scolymus]